MQKITTLFSHLLFISVFFLSASVYAQSTCAWAKKAGGSNEDYASDVITDASGNVYSLGNFYSQTIVISGTTLTNQPYAAFNYGTEMFLVKYDSCGNFKWAKQAGGNSDTRGTGLAVDAAGNVYVSGYSSADTVSFGALKLITKEYIDAFVVKYDANGIAQWARQGTGDYHDRAYGVAVDASNNVYLTGTFSSTYVRFGNDSIRNRNSDDDIFIVKYDNSGTVQWLRGGTGDYDDQPFGIGTDANGNIYVGGTFGSSYIRFGTDSLALHGYYDIFVVKYNSNGAEQWLKTAGAGDDDEAMGLATDAAGNTYITGFIGYNSTVAFGTHSITNPNSSLASFIAKYDAGGTAQWAKKGQGNSYTFSFGRDITLDLNGDPYIIGYSDSDSLNLGAVTIYNNSITAGNGGGGDTLYDVFVAKYKTNGNLAWARSAGGTGHDFGRAITTHGNNNAYIVGEYMSPSIVLAGITLTSSNPMGDAFISNNIAASSLIPAICEVTVDSLSHYNRIYWDKTAFTTVDSFIVYREVSSGVYKRIGSKPYDSLSMLIDTARSIGPANGNPNIGSYRYKLQTVDSSGTYSPLSPYHNTVYIAGSGGVFTWNTYNVEGVTLTPVTIFYLQRDDNSTGVWNLIGAVAGTQTFLSDPNAASYPNGSWMVYGSGFDCTPTRGAINTSRSNIKTASIGIKTNEQGVQLNVYPNPFNNNLIFDIATENMQVYTLEITNTLGQLIKSIQVNAAKTIVNTEDWAGGIYFYKLFNAGHLNSGKITKE